MPQLLHSFLRDQRGGTGIEYALVAGGISIVIAAGVNGMSDSTNRSFNGVADGLELGNSGQ